MSRLFRTPGGDRLLRSKNAVPIGIEQKHHYGAVHEDGEIVWLPESTFSDCVELSDAEQIEFEAIPAVRAAIDEHLARQSSVIVCTRGRRDRRQCQEPGCTAEHVALCDYPIAGGKTCDRLMCRQHRHPVTGKKNTDYCTPHHKMVRSTDGR